MPARPARPFTDGEEAVRLALSTHAHLTNQRAQAPDKVSSEAPDDVTYAVLQRFALVTRSRNYGLTASMS